MTKKKKSMPHSDSEWRKILKYQPENIEKLNFDLKQTNLMKKLSNIIDNSQALTKHFWCYELISKAIIIMYKIWLVQSTSKTVYLCLQAQLSLGQPLFFDRQKPQLGALRMLYFRTCWVSESSSTIYHQVPRPYFVSVFKEQRKNEVGNLFCHGQGWFGQFWAV